MPASPATVAAFLVGESEAGRAVATTRRRLATIAKAHKVAGMVNPCEAEAVRDTIAGIARIRGTDQKQATPLNLSVVHEMTRNLKRSGDLKDIRDLALVMCAHDLMARASEIASLTVEAVSFESDGTAVVKLRRSKTMTETGTYLIAEDATEALRRWLEASGIKAGPIWRSLTKGGKKKVRSLRTGVITRGDVSDILRDLGVRFNLEGQLSGHSPRIGMAQDMVSADIDIGAVMQVGGWSSPEMVARYTRRIAAKKGAVSRVHARHK
jgi:integrase